MPLTATSDILDNSTVHTGVPEILKAVAHYAAVEQGQAGAYPALNASVYAQEYGKIKTLFAQFYGCDPASLTWKKLHSLLTTDIGRNATAAECILGPVLRLYLGHDLDKGPYPPISMQEVAKKLYLPLGIQVQCYQRPSGLADSGSLGLDREGYLPVKESKMEAEVFAIKVYNEGKDHWDRLRRGELEVGEKSQTRLLYDCQEVSEAYDLFSSGPGATQAGLKKLKAAVGRLYAAGPVEEKSRNPLPLVSSEQQLIERQVASAGKAYEARLRMKFGAGYKQEEVKEAMAKVRGHYSNLFSREQKNEFKVAAGDQIKPEELTDSLIRKKDETDQAFATRLQEAELRSFRLGKNK